MSSEKKEKGRSILLNITIGIIFILVVCYIGWLISLAIAQNYIANDGKAILITYSVAKKIGQYKEKSGEFPKINELKSIIKELKFEKKVIIISEGTLKIKCGKAIKGEIMKKWINVHIDKKNMAVKFEEGYINSEGKNWYDKGPMSILSEDK